MDIAIIRHFPTNWNKKGYLQGKRDIPISLPLSCESEKQMIENKQKLQQLPPFDYVFASELARTKQTAALYGYPSPIIEPLLNELDFGSFEGSTKKELIKAHKEWLASPLDLTLGESLCDFQQRIFTFLNKYKHAHSILIFGHGTWARAFASIQTAGTIKRMNQLEIKNNELVIIQTNAAN